MSADLPPRRLLDGGGEEPGDPAVRRLLGELGEPPADEQMAERVWRRLETPSRTAVPWARWALAAGVAGLVAAVVLVGRPHRSLPERATVELAAGDVSRVHGDDPLAALHEGQPLAEGDRLRTGVGARAVLRVEPSLRLALGESSELALDDRLEQRGATWTGDELTAEVGAASSPFRLNVVPYVVEAADASFQVLVRAAGEMVVAVRRGDVDVIEGAQRWRVHAGSTWDSAHPDSHDVTPPRGEKPLAAPVAPAPVAPSAPSTPAASVASEAIRKTGAPKHASSTAAAQAAKLAAPIAPPGTAPAAPSVSTPLPPHDYTEGLALSRAGHYAEAAARLAAAAAAHGVHADLALYELGRLRQRQLGDREGARLAFAQYRTDYPHGTLQQEVQLSLIEVNSSLQKNDDALAGATDFLRAFPQNERAPDIRLLRAHLLREKGDCAGALAEYQRLTPSPTLGESALYFQAWCQRHENHAPEAEASLNELLRRFPHGEHAAEARAALGSPP